MGISTGLSAGINKIYEHEPRQIGAESAAGKVPRMKQIEPEIAAIAKAGPCKICAR